MENNDSSNSNNSPFFEGSTTEAIALASQTQVPLIVYIYGNRRGIID